MKLIISFLLLFCAFVAAEELYSTDLETLETPQRYCGRRLNRAYYYYCDKDNYDRIQNILGDPKKSDNDRPGGITATCCRKMCTVRELMRFCVK